MEESQQILQVKLQPPLILKPLIRNRLLQEIGRALEGENVFYRKLTLVAAPAGYGKTTLLVNYCNHIDRDFCWLTLSEEDRSADRMIINLAAALDSHESINLNLDGYLQGGDFSGGDDFEKGKKILIEILNRMEELESPFYIFLDELEHICSRMVYRLLEYFIANLPPAAHIIAASRVEPPWPLIRWKARRQAKIITAEELQFNIEETKKFVEQQKTDKALDNQQAKVLYEKTEGWVTGLQLISLVPDLSLDEVIEKDLPPSKGEIMDYLLEEVLSGQEREIKEFLLRTAPLPRFNQELCAKVTGMDNHQQLLEKVQQRKLFLQEMKGKNNWYRYHSLFAKILSRRFELENQELKREIHRVASEWFAEKELYKLAVEQAIAGDNYEMITRIIFRKNDDFFRRGEKSILKHWLNKLPEDLITGHPELRLVQAMITLIEGDIQTAEKELMIIRERLKEEKAELNNRDRDLMEGILAVGSAILKIFQGEREVQNFLEIADNLLPPDCYWRTMAFVKYGDMLSMTGDIAGALQCFRRIKARISDDNYGYFVQFVEGREIYFLWFMGNLERAESLCNEHLQRAGKHKMLNTTWIAGSRALRGNIYCEQGEFAKARKDLIKAREIVPFSSSEIFIGFFIKRMWLRYYFSTKKFDKARDLINNLNLWECKDMDDIMVNRLIARVIRFWLKEEYPGEEDWEDALQLLTDRGVIPGRKFRIFEIMEYLTLGRVLLTAERISEAQNVLEKVRECTRQHGLVRYYLESELLLTMLFYKNNSEKKAVLHLKKIINKAAKLGYFMLIIDEGREIVPLLEKLKTTENSISVKGEKLLNRLLANFDKGYNRKGILPEHLSEREEEVLKEIATGYTAKEIADRLNISPGTVRWHCSNIYGKLGVKNRGKAVSKARKLGLLE